MLDTSIFKISIYGVADKLDLVAEGLAASSRSSVRVRYN